jgi:hypothetical protein
MSAKFIYNAMTTLSKAICYQIDIYIGKGLNDNTVNRQFNCCFITMTQLTIVSFLLMFNILLGIAYKVNAWALCLFNGLVDIFGALCHFQCEFGCDS